DIDRNGIVNVTAKDRGTGREQKITVTSSTGLTETDIDKLVKEAEEHAEEDKAKREAIELRNQADNSLWAVDRTIKELGDKVTAEQKAEVEAAKEALKAAVEKDDADEIKKKMKELDEVLHRISEKLYQEAQAAGPQGSAGTSEAQGDDEDIVDADFTEES
ncbi:MAG TPA: molecular chaperone DnaK, partial [Firmicutes bacterium]|nr:molecular chaperone DnaK [Bacillota bacterium]